ncbi:MAG: hypothetical protein R2705_06325 [Ilumatobacteraceae bacterium]
MRAPSARPALKKRVLQISAIVVVAIALAALFSVFGGSDDSNPADTTVPATTVATPTSS